MDFVWFWIILAVVTVLILFLLRKHFRRVVIICVLVWGMMLLWKWIAPNSANTFFAMLAQLPKSFTHTGDNVLASGSSLGASGVISYRTDIVVPDDVELMIGFRLGARDTIQHNVGEEEAYEIIIRPITTHSAAPVVHQQVPVSRGLTQQDFDEARQIFSFL